MSDNTIDLIDINEPKFDKTLTGVFGSFYTQNSFEINYLLTSLNYKEINDLVVAADAFDFNQIDFDEMIQRDIDEKRVNEEIVEQYLEEGSDTPLFFPPLIVSVVAFDDDDKPLHSYKGSREKKGKSKEREIFTKIWDRHLELELTEINSGFDVYNPDEYDEIKIYKYLTKLRIDSKLVKLVVIDGQHRFKALLKFSERNSKANKYLNLPICLCFSPKAISGETEDMVATLRNMFVTINNKGKQVSGHYIDLLNDNSLASHTVRQLANKWKNEKEDPLDNKLQFLEWNQRSNAKSRRVTRPQSITTVSMLCESLRTSVFLNKNIPHLYNILDLECKKDELELEGFSIHDISETNFTHIQRPILYKLIEERILPSVDLLLTTPSVYSSMIVNFNTAVEKLNTKSKGNKSGFKSFIKILKSFKEVDSKIDHEATVLASDYFYGLIKTNEYIDNYRRLVFNQAYFRAWTLVLDSHKLFRENILEFTKVFIEALEVLAFDSDKNIFSKDKEFNYLTLYKNSKPNTTNIGKNCWLNLLLSTFSREDVMSKILKFSDELNIPPEELKPLYESIQGSTQNFVQSIKDEILKDMNKNWKSKDFNASFKANLARLENIKNKKSNEEIKNELEKKAKEVFEERIEVYSNYLDLSKEDLVE